MVRRNSKVRLALIVTGAAAVLGALTGSVVLLFWDGATDPSDTGWGKPDHGIQAMIYCSHLIRRPGQRYEERLSLRNIGRRAQQMTSFPYVSDTKWEDSTVIAEGTGNERIARAPKIRIEPGQVLQVWHRSPKAEDLGAYGYQVHFFFEDSGIAVATNRVTVYVIPDRPFWVAVVVAEVVVLWLLSRHVRRAAKRQV